MSAKVMSNLNMIVWFCDVLKKKGFFLRLKKKYLASTQMKLYY